MVSNRFIAFVYLPIILNLSLTHATTLTLPATQATFLNSGSSTPNTNPSNLVVGYIVPDSTPVYFGTIMKFDFRPYFLTTPTLNGATLTMTLSSAGSSLGSWCICPASWDISTVNWYNVPACTTSLGSWNPYPNGPTQNTDQTWFIAPSSLPDLSTSEVSFSIGAPSSTVGTYSTYVSLTVDYVEPTPPPTPPPTPSPTPPPTPPTPIPTPIPTPEPTPEPTPQPTPEPTPIPTPIPTPTPTSSIPTPASTQPTTTTQPSPTQPPATTFSNSEVDTNTNGLITSSSAIGSTSVVIGSVLGVLFLLICLAAGIAIFFVFKRRRNSTQQRKESETQNDQSINLTETNATLDQNKQYAPISAIPNNPSSGYQTTNQVNSQYQSFSPKSTPIITSQYESPNLQNSANQALSEMFERYSIPFHELVMEKEVGKGNFGSVYLAHRKSNSNEKIACKQLSSNNQSESSTTISQALKQQSKALKDFVAEAKVLQSIPPSPYVVRFVGLCAEPFCILTEFIDGGSLIDFLQNRNEEVKISIVFGFLKQICIGMAHLHKNGIIHRDLAARNVLLRTSIDEKTGVRQCVLVDMGLARLSDTGGDYLKTKSSIPLKWTSPEALRERKFSEKSDVYSFGIISIECFTRNTPFPDKTALDLAMSVVSGRFKPSVSEMCPENIASVLNQCLSLNPNERPTASQILSQFNSISSSD